MDQMNSIVAVFDTHLEAEKAVEELRKSGYPMRQLSVVARNCNGKDKAVGYYFTGTRMKYLGEMGSFWRTMWDQLYGAAFFSIPGLGPLLVGGPMVSWIVTALESAFTGEGLGAVAVGLYSIGMGDEGVLKCETALRTGRLVLIAYGSCSDVTGAGELLESLATGEVEIYGSPSFPTNVPGKCAVDEVRRPGGRLQLLKPQRVR